MFVNFKFRKFEEDILTVNKDGLIMGEISAAHARPAVKPSTDVRHLPCAN